MSKISAVVEPPVPPAILGRLHTLSSAPYAALKARIESGEPAIEFILFRGDADENFAAVRRFLDEAASWPCRVRYYELDETESLADVDLAVAEIGPDAIRRVLEASERDRDRFREEANRGQPPSN